MKHFLLTITLIFLVGLLFAQQNEKVSIKFIDSQTNKAIQGVHIKLRNSLKVSNEFGWVSIPVSDKQSSVRISHIAYRDTIVTILSINQIVTIRLQQDVATLPTAQVSNEAYAVFSPESTHVFDFEFVTDTLLVLTYEKEQMFRKSQDQSEDMFLGCELVVVGPSGNILYTTSLPDYTIGFHRDGLKQLFVKGKGFATMVSLSSFGPILSEVDFEVFKSQILPLKNSSSWAYYFDDQTWDYPEFTYYSKAKTSGNVSPLRTLSDEFVMELFRAEYKYMSNRDKLNALRLEHETGIDKEIYGAYMSGFQHSLYYHSIYAPLFSLGDSIVIFDHHNNQIYFHDIQGQALDSIGLNYHSKEMGKFDNQLIQDPVRSCIYAVYKRNGRKFLREVSLKNGNASDKITLYYPYPEKIKVIDSRVFYVYRKTDGQNTKHLYAEHLAD